jgi:peptidoglycan/xylan/chitin deacetylase (PgdA/CDA1 family)
LIRPPAVVAALLAAGAVTSAAATGAPAADPSCRGTVYLTLDTGNMSQAEAIAQTLLRHRVRATFFLANERTPRGDHALDDAWAPYWRARLAEGHAFGSHTYDHVYFRAAGPAGDGAIVLARPQFGARAGQNLRWDAPALCAELDRVRERWRELTGGSLDPFWRAPGGRAPAPAMAAAKGCGYAHVHWAPAGFLGDELSSETHPNETLLRQALAGIAPGDILMAHLGIWSRKVPWAPMLDPLIAGLKARGMCFATLREHPDHARR